MIGGRLINLYGHLTVIDDDEYEDTNFIGDSRDCSSVLMIVLLLR